MKSNHLIAIILAILLFGGGYYLWTTSNAEPSAEAPTGDGSESGVSTATNYGECVAEGGELLPGDEEKCLTVSGNVFINGVEE